MFSDLEHKAFLLGRRMADTAFSMDDNPFTNLQPRLARRWLDGYVSENALHGKAGWLGHDGELPRSQEHQAERGEKTPRDVDFLEASHAQA